MSLKRGHIVKLASGRKAIVLDGGAASAVVCVFPRAGFQSDAAAYQTEDGPQVREAKTWSVTVVGKAKRVPRICDIVRRREERSR